MARRRPRSRRRLKGVANKYTKAWVVGKDGKYFKRRILEKDGNWKKIGTNKGEPVYARVTKKKVKPTTKPTSKQESSLDLKERPAKVSYDEAFNKAYKHSEELGSERFNNPDLQYAYSEAAKKNGLGVPGTIPMEALEKDKDKWLKILGSEEEWNRLKLDAYQLAKWDYNKYPTWKQAEYLNGITTQNTAMYKGDRAHYNALSARTDAEGYITVYRGVSNWKPSKSSELGSSWSSGQGTAVGFLDLQKNFGGQSGPYRVIVARVPLKNTIPIGNGMVDTEVVIPPANLDSVEITTTVVWNDL